MKLQKREKIGRIVFLTLLGLLLLILLWQGIRGRMQFVKDFSPKKDASIHSQIKLTFNKVVVDSSKLDQHFYAFPIKFYPAIEGNFKWEKENKLVFYPSRPLLPSTEYQAIILPEIKKITQQFLRGRKLFTFTTERFRVVKASAFIERQYPMKDTARIKIGLEFNHPTDPRKISELTKLLDDAGQPLEYGIEPSYKSKRLTLYTLPLAISKEEKKEITVAISEELTCVNGSLGLETDYTGYFTLATGKELKVTEGPKGESGPEENIITLEFSSSVEPQEIKDYLNVEPAVDYRIEDELNYIYLKGKFEIGEKYIIKIRSGLPGRDASKLFADYRGEVVLPDLEPYISFLSKGAFLSSKGNLKLGVETININVIEITVKKVFLNNLVFFLNTNDSDDFFQPSGGYSFDYVRYFELLGKDVCSKEIEITHAKNKKVLNSLNLQDMFKGDLKGVYQVAVRSKAQHYKRDRKWVLITDIGLLAKAYGDELLVLANSLSKVRPMGGVKISLVSENNQIITSQYSDKNGAARFVNLNKLSEEFTPYIITAEKGKDYSFLDFENCLLSTVAFDISGADILKTGIKGFIHFERDIYRPGETVHMVGLVRDKNNLPLQNLPVVLEIMDPRNKIFKEFNFRLPANGAKELSLEIPKYANTGFYIARLMVANEELGRNRFQIEDFMPDRIKVEIETDKDIYYKGDTIQATVISNYLFGAPVAYKKVEAHCEVTAKSFRNQEFPAYVFSNQEIKFEEMSISLGEDKLDGSGRKIFSFTLPHSLRPPGELSLRINAVVHEEGGRTVTAYKTVLYHYYDYYIGLIKETAGDVPVGNKVAFSFIVLKPTGEVISDEELEIYFFHRYWHTVLKKDRQDRYRYVSELEEELVDKKMVKSKAKPEYLSFVPKRYGEYRVEIYSPKNKSSTSLKFDTGGWGYAPWAMGHPDKLQLSFEKSTYKVGEKAKLQVRAPYSGKLIIFCEREKVFSYHVYNLKDNTAMIDIPVLASYKPNIYISASLLHSVDTLEPQSPARAYGIIPLMVDCSEKKLHVQIEGPEEVRPRKSLQVNLKVRGSAEKCWLTLAAVDEGICQLTAYKTPDPFSYFYQKQKLLVESFDLYAYVLPELTEMKGGGMPEVEKKPRGPSSLARVKPVSLWSGIVETDAKGNAMVSFDIPQFNGSLRLMAVAHSGDKFGNATKSVTVREPIIIMPTFPRFTTGGDKITMPVVIFNGTGKQAVFQVRVQLGGPLELEDEGIKSVEILPEQEGVVKYEVKVAGLSGFGHLKITAEGAGERSEVEINVPIRPPVPEETVGDSGTLSDHKPVSINMPDFWTENTDKYSLVISPSPVIQFTGSLEYLLRYPHGCVEQTTSQTFPLLYFKYLAQKLQPELFKKHDVDFYVEKGLERLISMQIPSGDLAYWPGGDDVNEWGSVYGSHCLVEAKKTGYVIPDYVRQGLKKSLIRFTKESRASRYSHSHALQVRVYACYVLALMGHPERGTMNYLRKEHLNNMPLFSRAQLAATYYLMGERETARTILPLSITPEHFERETGGNFNSSIKANAIILAALLDIDPDNAAIPVLIKELVEAADKKGRWPSTQDNAFALLALGKTLKKTAGQIYQGVVRIDGKEYAQFSSSDTFKLVSEKWDGQEINLEITGKGGPAYYYWSSAGIRKDGKIENYDRDIKVRRTFLGRNGAKMDLKNIEQGKIIIAEIELQGAKKDYENIIVGDMLPAGFEIENPRLQSRENIPWIEDRSVEIDYMNIRDDRIYIFTGLKTGKVKKLHYALRAVTAGNFILPPVKAEAMYDPLIASVASQGEVHIKETK